MAIYVVCSECYRRQSRKHKKCAKCNASLARDRRKVYVVGYRTVAGSVEKFERIGTNLEQAKNREAEILQKRFSGYEIEKNKNTSVTLRALFDWFLEEPSVKDLSSYDRYVQMSRHLMRILGENRIVADLFEGVLKTYLSQRIKEPSTSRLGQCVAPATADKELQCLRAALNSAVEGRIISFNPIKALPQLKVDNSRTFYIDPDAFDRLVSHLPPHLQQIVTVAYYLGMRQSEITNLTWDQVDMKKQVIQLETEETKEGKPKTIPIMDGAIEVFHDLPRGIGQSRVFLRKGKPFFFDGGCSSSWKNACKAVDLSASTFHDLRHTAITNMILLGYPTSFIMSVTGHSNLKMHLRYAELNGERLWQIIEKVKSSKS